jgi:broad specificity phosphatase PhoE
MKVLRILIVSALLLAVARVATGEQVVFVVRHAERADGGAGAPSPPSAPGMMANDPPLSAAGEQRAAKLASLLASAGIRQIFVTEYRRTQQTADPLARQMGVTSAIRPSKDSDSLIADVRRADGNVLVVGHSNTVPDVLKKLGVTDAVTIADSDYDNLFVVFRDKAGVGTLVRLKY